MIHRYKCLSWFLYLESVVKNKDTIQTSPSNTKSNGTSKNFFDELFQIKIIFFLASTKSINNNNVVSVLKSDTISILKPDDHFDDFFVDTNKNLNNESSIQLNTDDLNRIAENAVR
jgi:hypothetical protein